MNICIECLKELKSKEVIWCPDCCGSYCKDCIDGHKRESNENENEE